MTIWILWAFILVTQTFASTFNSRARNSGSLRKHLLAATVSNGVWFISQGIIITKLYAIMTGAGGLWLAVFTGLFYTAFTLVGAAAAHYIALRTEQGKGAVGASAKYAQITREEWQEIQIDLLQLRHEFNIKESTR